MSSTSLHTFKYDCELCWSAGTCGTFLVAWLAFFLRDRYRNTHDNETIMRKKCSARRDKSSNIVLENISTHTSLSKCCSVDKVVAAIVISAMADFRLNLKFLFFAASVLSAVSSKIENLKSTEIPIQSDLVVASTSAVSAVSSTKFDSTLQTLKLDATTQSIKFSSTPPTVNLNSSSAFASTPKSPIDFGKGSKIFSNEETKSRFSYSIVKQCGVGESCIRFCCMNTTNCEKEENFDLSFDPKAKNLSSSYKIIEGEPNCKDRFEETSYWEFLEVKSN